MEKVPVKLIKLQKDKRKYKTEVLGSQSRTPPFSKKGLKNPGWALPTDGEVVELPEVKYDEATVIQVLEKAGGKSKKSPGSRRLKPRQLRPWKKSIQSKERRSDWTQKEGG